MRRTRKSSSQLLANYFHDWMTTYKQGAVREVTFRKYEMTYQHLLDLAPSTRLCDLDRQEYQRILNAFAEHHEHNTVMDFHHQVKAALLDAVDDRLIDVDPTRRAVVKGTVSRKHKPKFLSKAELSKLMDQLDLGGEPDTDFLIYLIAKTGLRFAEALAITQGDIDPQRQTISVTKTWNYKDGGGFAPTKNRSSRRKVRINYDLLERLRRMGEDRPKDQPLFVADGRRIYNATVNDRLARLCGRAGIPVISVHGLRHTHASLLLYAGVSTASVSKRLGHSTISTTQDTYLHIIKELESQDNDRVLGALNEIG